MFLPYYHPRNNVRRFPSMTALQNFASDHTQCNKARNKIR